MPDFRTPLGVAWQCLRRNRFYRAHWDRRAELDPATRADVALRYAVKDLVDPALDAIEPHCWREDYNRYQLGNPPTFNAEWVAKKLAMPDIAVNSQRWFAEALGQGRAEHLFRGEPRLTTPGTVYIPIDLSRPLAHQFATWEFACGDMQRRAGYETLGGRKPRMRGWRQSLQVYDFGTKKGLSYDWDTRKWSAHQGGEARAAIMRKAGEDFFPNRSDKGNEIALAEHAFIEMARMIGGEEWEATQRWNYRPGYIDLLLRPGGTSG